MDKFTENMDFEQRQTQKVNKISQKVRLKSTLVLLVIAILAVITATLAWFTISSLVGLDNMQMSIGTGVGLYVSTSDHGTDLDSYSHTITNEMVNAQLASYNTRLSDFSLMPLTSSDGLSFANQAGNKQAENKNSFLEMEFYFIATDDMWVHLTSDNTGVDKDDGTRVSTTSTGTQSEVVRCMRVSFKSDSDSAVIYEPNKAAGIAGQTTFDLPAAGSMVYNNDNRIFHLYAMTPTKVKIRIWLEGEDPQCTDNVQKANIAVQLCFIGTNENNELLS
ncbi:MAG TPA: hypothetical protein GX401_08930 [Clostridiales bacterium]|nr:hypothetical protein [Clostridiales bacterium]